MPWSFWVRAHLKRTESATFKNNSFSFVFFSFCFRFVGWGVPPPCRRSPRSFLVGWSLLPYWSGSVPRPCKLGGQPRKEERRPKQPGERGANQHGREAKKNDGEGGEGSSQPTREGRRPNQEGERDTPQPPKKREPGEKPQPGDGPTKKVEGRPQARKGGETLQPEREGEMKSAKCTQMFS